MAIKDWIREGIFKKFSPFKTLVFNSLSQEIKVRPVIIFYDSEEDYYYYIKARDAYNKNGKLKKRRQGEVLIEKSDKPNTLFTKDSYLDCSQIFYINDIELKELTKKYPKTTILDSKELEYNQVEKIFENIYKCLTSEPPYIVISEVSYDLKTRKTKSDVQYASDEHLNNDYEKAISETQENKRIEELKELKNKLIINKDQTRLDLFETVLGDAWREYRQEKVYNPLFKWISENKFIQKGLNSLEIIQEYRRLLNPITPISIDAKIVFNSLWKKRDLVNQLEKTDYKFMIDWIGKNDLDVNMKTFRKFRKAMQKEWYQGEVFYFHKLENQLEEKLSKLEKEIDNKDQFINKENKQKNTNQLNHSNSAWDKAKQKPEEEKDKNKKKLKMKM
ncbi:Mbov_0400 family ICE element protein [Mycoplasma sp. 'Moose RK']|uniref:Mbov_0400 family ICE element protein n=1 Tax=Mycoplasma sp. 'Moose RK' TaxID=2780095 RepID=UPI0018C2B8ED|nr:hypothetical protein [Mycoplasma sp. 'Moose RK']MBG0730758.1 hypothetical protein [Mycoplasma sp. 'Moose RK']